MEAAAIGSSRRREEVGGRVQRDVIKGGLCSEMTIGDSSVPSTLIGLLLGSLQPKEQFGIPLKGSPIQRLSSQE